MADRRWARARPADIDVAEMERLLSLALERGRRASPTCTSEHHRTSSILLEERDHPHGLRRA